MFPQTQIEIDGKTYAAELATIKRTTLGDNDHGIFTAGISCEWRAGGIDPTGAYALDNPLWSEGKGKFLGRVGTGAGMDFISRIMEVVGASSWEKIPGKRVWVLFPDRASNLGSQASGIASVDSDKYLIFEDFWADAFSKEAVGG